MTYLSLPLSICLSELSNLQEKQREQWRFTCQTSEIITLTLRRTWYSIVRFGLKAIITHTQNLDHFCFLLLDLSSSQFMTN